MAESCNCIDCTPQGSSVHGERLLLNDKTPGFLASRGDEFNLGPGIYKTKIRGARGKAADCSSFLTKKVKSLSRVQLFATSWAVAYQAPLSLGFPR